MSDSNRVIRPHRGRADKIIAGFEKDGNQWKTSNDIAQYLPTDKTTLRYNIISQMSSCTPPLLEKTPYMNGTNKYRLAADYKQAYLSLFPSLPAIKALVNTLPTGDVDELSRHVRWDEGEWSLMIEQVRELRRRMPGLVVLDAARKAQDVLISQGLMSRTRRRPLNSQSAIQPIIHALFNDDGTPKPDPADEPVHAEPSDGEIYEAVSKEAAPEEHQQAMEEVVALAEVARDQLDAPTIGSTIDTLFGLFANRLGDTIADAVSRGVADGIAKGFASLQPTAKPETKTREMGAPPTLDDLKPTPGMPVIPPSLVQAIDMVNIGATFPKPPKHNPEPPREFKDRRPRLLLLGMRPDEVQILKKEFDDVFDLRFWSPEESNAKLKGMARSVTRAFALVNRLFHKSSENLVTGAGVPYTRVHGNVNQMQEALTSYFAEQPS